MTSRDEANAARDKHEQESVTEPTMPTMHRRDFLLATASAAACAILPSFARAGDKTLGQIAAAKDLLFGSPLGVSRLTGDPGYSAMARECSLYVCADMHWRLVAPNPETTDFTKPDAAHQWALAHGMKFRGHALVWHLQMPPWFEGLPDRAAAVRALQFHIHAMGTHFAGAMQSWDVVNEAIQIGHRSDGLRETAFLRQIGPEYLDIAFQAAREADPRAALVLNENSLEYDVREQRRQRNALLRLVDGFKRRTTPIDAIGIQSHLSTAERGTFKEDVFARFLGEISARGLKIMLTEMDMIDTGSPSDVKARDADVAAFYRRYLDVALDNKATTAVITWGLTDKESWIRHGRFPQFVRKDGLPARPLPFDDDYRRKPAYDAIAQALAAAAPR
jgi:endo-1,4-beta-xylanase